MNKKLRIVFMGNTDFSIFSLKELIKNNYFIVGIITRSDKTYYKHGKKILKSPVKQIALNNNLPLFEYNNIEDSNLLEYLIKCNPDIQIVVSFPIIPKKIWSLPKKGTFNLHPSILPDYRGPAPINWAIINGETKTGVTTFMINNKIDAGKIILQKKISINPNETFGNLSEKLSRFGSFLVLETIKKLISSDKSFDVNNKKNYFNFSLKNAPKIKHNNCKIDWNLSLIEIYNKIRALNPYPGSWTTLPIFKNYSYFKIYSVDIIKTSHAYQIGEIIVNKSKLIIAVKDGYISILEGQLPGKKKMFITDIINGVKFL